MKNRQTYKRTLILIFFLTSLLTNYWVTAQDRNIYEIGANMSQNNDRSDFYELAFNLKPTVYFKDNVLINKYGEGEILKITLEDTKSFEALISSQTNYKSTELIIIKINDVSHLNKAIDFTSLTELSQLKYIFIKCYFKTNTQQIEDIISANPGVRVFYFAQKPS